MEPVFLDFEGTEHGEVLSIGAIYNNHKFYSLIRPKTMDGLSPRIMKLTKISPELVKKQQLFPEVFDRFLGWLPSDVPVYVWGSNDSHMLIVTDRNETEDFRHDRMKNIQKPLSPFLRPGKGVVGLQNAAKILGIEIVQSHNALDDAFLMRSVFRALANRSDSELLEMLRKNFPSFQEPKLKSMLSAGLKTLRV